MKFNRFTLRAASAVVAASAVAFASSVQAAVPAEVTAAVGDMKTDGLAVAGAVLVAIIAIAAIKFIRKGL